MEKIIRTVCAFSDQPSTDTVQRRRLIGAGFTVQTKRLCSPMDIGAFEETVNDSSVLLSIGSLPYEKAVATLPALLRSTSVSMNVNLTSEAIERKHVELLFEVIRTNPSKTFNFAYVFNNAPSSPYFPSAQCQKNGFAIGLQPTNLAEGCTTLEQWLTRMQGAWKEIMDICGDEKDFLGIDSSIAPLFTGWGSFVHFIRSLGMSFSQSATTDVYVRTSNFIKTKNPRPVGLCGIMLPCLEDFALAEEYEVGDFSIERNIYLSLHSGLGIDTYPIGIDENPERVVQILSLIQALSNKHAKPLSARFVSDGKARIGDRAAFGNQYLKDVIIHPL
jgi:uncharacterized protein (UPF0210 family)